MGEYELSACEGKECLDYDMAKRIARRMTSLAYRCKHCRAWHVGSVTGKRRDGGRRRYKRRKWVDRESGASW